MAVPYGKYQLLKKIGSGGMGQVFLARHAGEQGFEKLVVIKRILPHLAEEAEFLTMFFDEARIAARLNHPNLVQIFDLGEANRSSYLAMEYVAGEDLRKLDRFARANGGLIPMGPALRIIADAAAGLDYAHKARDAQGRPLGLVHRDVSPQNILVGFDGAVKLIDFGVAKAAGRVQHTGTGILKGKYPYMSPEQAEGRELDARSDIFALGVVLWEILTGKRLFKADSDLATLRLVVDCKVPPPSKLNPKLPQGLDLVVLQALARSPDQRFPDAAAFRLQIEEFLLAHRVPASSAHLNAYLSNLYQARIAHEADPSSLDEFQEGVDPDVDHTPSQSTPGSRNQWRNRPPSGQQPAIGARPSSKSTPAVKSSAKAAPVGRTASAPATQAPAGAAEAVGAFTASLPENHASANGRPGAWLFGGVAAGALLLAGVGVVVLRPVAPAPLSVVSAPPPSQPAVVLPAPKPAEPAPAPTVVVTLASQPTGADVEIDGRVVGRTPLDYALEGQQSVVAVFSLQGFEPHQATVTSAEAPELSVRLAKKRTPLRRPPGPLGIKTDR